MALGTFKGGVHPCYNKDATLGKPIESISLPEKVVIPLHQHTGAPCKPVVNVGDEVKIGQKIGDSDATLTAPIHASISGKVKAITEHPQSTGMDGMSVIIESDSFGTLDESIRPRDNVDRLNPEELIGIIKEAGIVGLGGAAFPTYFKLSPPKGKSFDCLLLNGAECEPYLSADHRLMVERPNDVVDGAKLLMKATGVKRVIIGIENNKPDAISALNKVAKDEEGIEIAGLDVKYPQGAEKQLIWAILRREVPSGGLPVDVGVVVNNVGTAVAVKEAVIHGSPLVRRVITVTGSCIREPKNLMVPIGTLVSDIIEICGGTQAPLKKLVVGGPMMGIAQHTTEIPVTKGTSGILLLSGEEVVLKDVLPCIRCGKCIEACPMNLMPLWLADYEEASRFDDCERLGALDCIECGCCSFICPSHRRLVEGIRLAKAEIVARRNAG